MGPWGANTRIGAWANGLFAMDSVSGTIQRIGHTNLLWHDATSGPLRLWQLSETRLTGIRNLAGSCSTGDQCANQWRTVDNTILWHNATTGQVRTWTYDATLTTEDLSAVCGASDNCSQSWRVIGRVRLNVPNCSSPCTNREPGLLWHNASSGELRVWRLSGNTVVGTESLSAGCGSGDNCSTSFKAVLTADFNADGQSDILWHNAASGELRMWLLNGTMVTSSPSLSWQCGASDGCSTSWRIVSAGDVNADGRPDLLFHNAATGELRSWLLNGQGAVSGTQSLQPLCAAGDNCSVTWKAAGFMSSNAW
jgi:hypothetical protein